MKRFDRRPVAIGVILVNVVLLSLALSACASVPAKPHYDTSPIYCERELPNSED